MFGRRADASGGTNSGGEEAGVYVCRSSLQPTFVPRLARPSHAISTICMYPSSRLVVGGFGSGEGEVPFADHRPSLNSNHGNGFCSLDR